MISLDFLRSGHQDGSFRRTVSASETDAATPGSFMTEVFAQIHAAAEAEQSAMPSSTSATYQEGFSERISALPIHPSQDNTSIAVRITEEGLNTMQANPHYADWVLALLSDDFAYENIWAPLCSDSYVVHTFGASMTAYQGNSWHAGYMNGQGQQLYESLAANATWSRYRTTSNESSAKSDEWAKLAAKLRLERMLQKMAQEHHRVQSELLTYASQHRALIEQMNRSGRRLAIEAAPLPRLHGVPAAYLLAMLGG